jgi:hypothetical protein
MRVCEAVLGRQVVDMSKDEMQKQMRYPGRQVPWALNLTQLLSVAPDGGDSALHRDGGYLELNLDATRRSRGR